jgi:hypothetical protein
LYEITEIVQHVFVKIFAHHKNFFAQCTIANALTTHFARVFDPALARTSILIQRDRCPVEKSSARLLRAPRKTELRPFLWHKRGQIRRAQQ